VIRDLLPNLQRTSEHPTLKTLVEIAEVCSLTLEGAHKLFGYHLGMIQEFDLRLNRGRTHIIESYPFKRDLLIDLPARLAPREAFDADAFLRDLVTEWQTDIPIRALEGGNWELPGAFYVHVGTEDSLGSSIPPGAIALAEPVGDAERASPNPRAIYLLQFANGYRCSRCVVTWGKLRLFNTGRTYLGRQEFAYPGSVRIAGRIRMFAANLPIPEYPLPYLLPHWRGRGDLILPWEHVDRHSLLATKHQRFKRSNEEKLFINEFLQAEFNAKLSGRSQRRYRSPTPSAPHVNALLHLTVAHFARYTDALRTGGAWASDRGRFSLETLLDARSLEDVGVVHRRVTLPAPADVWEARRKELGGWPILISMRFPELRLWEDRVIRLAKGSPIYGIDPAISPGSWLLLERIQSLPDPRSDKHKTGWSRPIYLLQRGVEMICGYLEKDSNQYALAAGAHGEVKAIFHADELCQLHRVLCAAVPV
jgi:hypothetical protein